MDFTGKRILVVDDIPINRTVLKNILIPTGAEIIEAKDGRQAVDIYLAESENIDLILMDIMMPYINGYKATEEIRISGLPNARTVPIIAVTTLTCKDYIDAAFKAGMDFHLEKPFEPQKLLITVMKYLSHGYGDLT